MRFDMMKRPFRLSKGIKKSKLKRKSISESRFPKSIKKKSSRRHVYEDIDDMEDQYSSMSDDDFIYEYEFNRHNQQANKQALIRAFRYYQMDDRRIKTILSIAEKTGRPYTNEDMFNALLEGNFVCVPEVKTFEDLGKFYLAVCFDSYSELINAFVGGAEKTINGIIDLSESISVDYESVGREVQRNVDRKFGSSDFVLSPSTGFFMYPATIFNDVLINPINKHDVNEFVDKMDSFY